AMREHAAFEREQVARREAESVSVAKDQFLATVSHELRTPLTVILGWAKLLGAGALGPEEQKRAIEIISHSARAQARLVEALLDISQIKAGRLHLDRKEVDLAAVTAAALDDARPAAAAKGIRMESDIDASLGLTSGDPVRLRQVVWNLLSNAIRF